VLSSRAGAAWRWAAKSARRSRVPAAEMGAMADPPARTVLEVRRGVARHRPRRHPARLQRSRTPPRAPSPRRADRTAEQPETGEPSNRRPAGHPRRLGTPRHRKRTIGVPRSCVLLLGRRMWATCVGPRASTVGSIAVSIDESPCRNVRVGTSCRAGHQRGSAGRSSTPGRDRPPACRLRRSGAEAARSIGKSGRSCPTRFSAMFCRFAQFVHGPAWHSRTARNTARRVASCMPIARRHAVRMPRAAEMLRRFDSTAVTPILAARITWSPVTCE
jgi:hypothetical protein